MAGKNTPAEVTPVEVAPADSLTSAVPVKKVEQTEPRVRIFIPLMPGEDDEEAEVKVDHYEHVTIEGKTTLIRRGEYVEVPVSVFLQLRNKYPKL